LTDNDDNKNAKISERMFLWDPTYTRATAMVIGTPFTLSSGGPGAESAALQRATLASGPVSGISTITFGGQPNATATNIAEDEAFSARPIFNFTNQTGSGASSIGTNTVLFVDLKTTMNTLLNTIHNANRTNNPADFKGFNFLNYDLRSFSSLNNPNAGGSISNVGVYLVYNNAGTGISAGGLGISGTPAVSLANSTNLQDFINLNGTTDALGNTGAPTASVANPAQLN